MNEFNEFDNPYSNVPTAEPVTPISARVLGYVTLGLGIVSVSSLFAGMPFAVAGLITAGIGRGKNSGRDTKPTRIGRILSIIGIPLSTLCLILYILFLVNIINYTDAFYAFVNM